VAAGGWRLHAAASGALSCLRRCVCWVVGQPYVGRVQLAIPSQQRPADPALTLADASGASHMRA